MAVSKNTGDYGDLKKFQVWLDDTDISSMVYSAHVFQELFSPTTTAIININDTTNLITSMPIQAGKRVRIIIESDNNAAGDGEQEWEMVVYKIGDKSSTQQNNLTYSLFAADKAFLKNQTKRLQKSFTNQKTSDIIQSVVSEAFGGSVDANPSDSSINLIIPGQTPFYAISHLLEISLNNGAADYVFFQNADASFSFKSFEKLYSDSSEDSGITFTSRPCQIDGPGNSKYDYTLNIGSYAFQHFDALSNIQTGFYSSKTFSFDFLSKVQKESKFKYGDDNSSDKSALSVDDSLLTDSEDATVTFVAKNSKLFENGKAYSDDADTQMPSRKSSLMKFEQNKIIFQIPGSAGAAKWFGKSVTIDLPSSNSLDSDEPIDKRLRGKYLITNMAHMINKDRYMINIEACKKRLEA